MTSSKYTFKKRHLEPGETCVDKSIIFPQEMLDDMCRDAINNLRMFYENNEDFIMGTVTIEAHATVLLSEKEQPEYTLAGEEE